MIKLLVVAALVGVSLSSPAARISPALLATLEKSATSNIFINFVGSNAKVLEKVEKIRTFSTRTERLNTLKSALEVHAKSSQRHVQEYLKSKSIPFRSFWVSNQIFVKNADKELVHALAALPQVEEVYEEQIVKLERPVSTGVIKGKGPVPLAEWGIERVRAQEVWHLTNGSGIIVSNIDTGVHYTHEALRSNYRASYGWLDPYDNTDLPNDQDGHGTHTMGTIAGSHGVGVAPGAQWIACKGCGTFSCSQAALTACGEWVLCPTLPDGSNEDCSKAPALVSNSWGSSGGNYWYEPITEAWVVGGLIPIFAIGNSGTSCRSAGSPGDFRRVIGVGATAIDNKLASFSGVGPAPDGRLKPELSAPGVNVRSAIPGSGDNSYDSYSGTSMACPHVAGVTALLLSYDSNLVFGQVRQALIDGSDTNTSGQGASCSGIGDDAVPNHHFGWGIINAEKMLNVFQKTK